MHTAPLHHDIARSWTVVLGLSLALALALLPVWPAPAQAQEQDRAGLEHACPESMPPQGFTDTQGNIHERSIDCAGWWGITRGGPGGLPASQYGPTLPVYRDQMASFIARMIDESDGEPLAQWDGQNRFADVSDENVHMQNINRLAAAGVVLGRSATEYAPRMIVRRDQMASFIARAIEYVTEVDRATDEDQFDDVDQDNVHRANINGLAVEGVVRGIGGGRYAPAVQVRRDAMASFVMRGIDLHVEEGFATPPETDDTEPTPDPTPDPAGDPEPSSTTQSVTEAPELMSIAVETETGTTVSVRYTFDEPVRSGDAVDEERFLLYGINTDTERFEASGAVRDSGNTSAVVATFDRADFDASVAAAVAHGAVQNLDEIGNPERALGLQGRSFPAGQTSAPDLVSVSGFASGPEGSVEADFVFDQTVTAASTSTSVFGLVLANGTWAQGGAVDEAQNSATVRVRFPSQSVANLSSARRGYTRAGAVTGSGGSSPRRAVALAEGGGTPRLDLVSVSIDRDEDTVAYTFDGPIGLASTPSAGNFAVYYIDGTQRSGLTGITADPPEVSSNRRTVTVQFADGAVNDLVVGASVNAGAVSGLEGANGVDSRGVAAEFLAGHVLGPRLVSATVGSGPLPGSTEVTWQFDKPVSTSDGAFAVYTEGGARITTTPSSAGMLSSNCTASGNEVTCAALLPPGTSLALATVAFDAVENSGNQTGAGGTVYPNYEQGRALAPA